LRSIGASPPKLLCEAGQNSGLVHPFGQ